MAASRGNVLFIVMDQFRADCLRGALAGALELPNLRALMAESVTFASHFTVTTPCGPARASLLTGQYAMNHRSVRNGAPLAADTPNLAREALALGYEPLLFGYTDTSADPRGRDPEDPDLRTYEGLMPGFAEIAQHRFDAGSRDWVAALKERGYALPEKYADLYRPAGDGLAAPALYRAEDSDTAYLTDRAIAEIGARRNAPWFAHVTYIRPHPPLVAPAPYNTMYDPAATPAPNRTGGVAARVAVHPFYDAFFGEPANTGLYHGFDGRMDRIGEADARQLRATYFALATEVDAHIGRLLAHLRETGALDDTLVVVTADHGEMLGDQFMWGKESPHDPAFHVPLIIRDPRRRAAAGTVVEAITESIDVAPTILDWLGRAAPASFDGASLMPFLDGRTPERWRDHAFMEIDLADPETPTRYQRRLGLRLAEANFAVLREARMKLVHFNGGLPPMLFDLANDPEENVDLAGDPAWAGELARLRARMLDHRMTHADSTLSRLKLTEAGVVAAPADA